jgi:hypothetical protein
MLIPFGMLAGFLAVLVCHPAGAGRQVGVAWNRLTVRTACPLLLFPAAAVGEHLRGRKDNLGTET